MNKRKAIPKKVRQSVYLMYNGHCAYCGTEIAYKDMQVDHATPLRIGGADDISNYMPACRSCNHYKATLDVEGFRRYLSEIHKRLMRGRNPDNPSDRALGSLTEQRLEVNMQDTSNCLTSVQKDNLLLEKPQYRIRKLTPRECGRLMSVSDEDIDKMAAVNSNTQLYKQFGNSIVVDVMCAMFKNLNIKQGDSNEALQTN